MGSRSLAILRFCAADAYLAVTPAKLGLVYGHAETRRLVELVGPSRAKDLLFTGRRIETEEALAIGLIDRRIETALHAAALGYARGLAALSQASIRGGKRAVDAIVAGMTVETPAFRALVESAALGVGLCRGARGLRAETDGEVLLSRRDRAASARPERIRLTAPAMISLVLDAPRVRFGSGLSTPRRRADH